MSKIGTAVHALEEAAGIATHPVTGVAKAAIHLVAEHDQDRADQLTRDLDAATQIDLAQIGVDQAEAEHAGVFVAGWRSFVGWIAGIGFFAHVIVFPAIAFAHDGTLPDNTLEMSVLGLLLGGDRVLQYVTDKGGEQK